jgi:hypothetical protein
MKLPSDYNPPLCEGKLLKNLSRDIPPGSLQGWSNELSAYIPLGKIFLVHFYRIESSTSIFGYYNVTDMNGQIKIIAGKVSIRSALFFAS